MNSIIPLTKIGFFNPGRLTDEEIEQSFIARLPFFEFIFKKVIAEKPGSIPQHYLIIGQRGMGKTSLLIRIASELRKTPYRSSFIPLSFPEEQYNVDRLSKFWLNCLDALADALDKEQQTKILKELDAEIGSLSKEKALDANAVYATFEKWISKINRRPVLLVDNLNLILSKTTKEEQHQLRAILMSEGAPILVGASATTIEETVDYGAPFYDAFQINYLKKLSFQESLDILLNLAKITGISDFANHLYSNKGRMEALYELTGGTPRTVAILFPLIQNGFSEAIQTDLDALLDMVTPLYKARFEELAPQLQVVLDATALHWDPINLEQLREITLLENQQLSPQLKRLVDVGWLQKLDAYGAKGGAYELSERFFNIWYLMRRSNRRQKRELNCLTKFLELFYGDDLHEIAINRIGYKVTTANGIALDLALADAIKEDELREKLKTKSYDSIVDLSLANENLLEDFSLPKQYKNQKLEELIDDANTKYYLESYNKAEVILKSALKIDQTLAPQWNLLGNIYSKHLINFESAEKAYKKAIESNNMLAYPWYNLGTLYMNNGLIQESEEAYRRSIEIDGTDASTWYNLGVLYMNSGRHHESENAFKKVIEIKKSFSYAWNNLGYLYQNYLNRSDEAEEAYLKAIELSPNDIRPKFNIIFLWRDEMNMWEEAKNLFETIAEPAELRDAYLLNKAVFALYDKNIGIAESCIKHALLQVGELLPADTTQGWFHFSAVIIKLGFADSLLKVFSENGYDIVFRPFYVAIEAAAKEDELFFNSIAAEVREPAKKILEKIKAYID